MVALDGEQSQFGQGVTVRRGRQALDGRDGPLGFLFGLTTRVFQGSGALDGRQDSIDLFAAPRFDRTPDE